MKIDRINIIGASGSGKTTLAKVLASRLGFLHFDSDHYYHLPTDPPFMQARPPDERMAMIETDLKVGSSWILSGAVTLWEPQPQLDYSMVVFLYLPPDIRLARVKQREQRLYGLRIQEGGDMYHTHDEFMNWTAGYDSGECEGTNTLGHHLSFLQTLTCPTLRLETPLSTEQQMQLVLEKIEAVKSR